MSGYELSVDVPLDKLRMGGQVQEKIDVGGQAGDVVLGKAGAQLAQSGLAVRAPHHQFGNHGVVVYRYLEVGQGGGLWVIPAGH